MTKTISVKLDDTVCRVCLSSSGSITIFDDCGKDDQFRYCTSLEATKDDGLPSKLCKKCNDHLKVAYDFRFQAIYAEKYFRKTIFLPSFKKEDHNSSNFIDGEVDTQNPNNHCSDELDENMAEIDMLLAIHTERVEDQTNDDTDDNDNCQHVEILDSSEFFDNDLVEENEKHTEIIGMETFEKEKREQKVKLEATNVLLANVSNSKETTIFKQSLASCSGLPSQSSVKQNNVSIEEIQQYTNSENFVQNSEMSQEICLETGTTKHLEIHPVLKNDPSAFDFNVPTTQISPSGSFDSFSATQIQFSSQMPAQIAFEQQQNSLVPLPEHANLGNFDFPYQEQFSTYHSQVALQQPQQQIPETPNQFQKLPDQLQTDQPHEKAFKAENQDKKSKITKKQKATSSTSNRKEKIECNICGSVFTHLNSLKTHLLKHSGEKPFKCEFCEKAFARKTVLNIHRRLHTGEKPYKCTLCPSAYVTKEALARHLQKDHVEEVGANFRRDKVSYICSICNKSRCSKYSLASHMKIHFNETKTRRKIIRKKKEKHSSDNKDSNVASGADLVLQPQNIPLKYSCKICHKGFPNKWELCTHAESHNMHKTFECDVCQRTFEKKFQLLYHLQTHEGAEDLIKAKVKPSSTKDKSLNKTIKKEEEESQSVEKPAKRKLRSSKRRKKKKIDYEDESENEMSNAKSEVEEEDDDKVVKTSNKKCTSRAQRENLKALRTSSKIECLICEAVFTHPTSLKTHMLVHSGERPFKCDHCDKSFARKTVLNIHRRLHTGEKPYKCPLCDSACVTKDALMRHMSKDHDDDREADRIKFTCGVCHKSMGSKYSLQTHMKLHEQNSSTNHPAELNFSCNMCTESFDTKSDYTKHMEVHDSHRNFQCDICQVTFEKKFKLLFHLQTHKIEDLPCKKCGETFTIRENLIQHVKVQHIDPQNMDFQCPTCNVVQYDTRDLKLHMLNVHEVAMGELNSCDLCGESHATAAEYYKHMHDKHDAISKTCNECKKYFDSRKAFDKHILTHYM